MAVDKAFLEKCKTDEKIVFKANIETKEEMQEILETLSLYNFNDITLIFRNYSAGLEPNHKKNKDIRLNCWQTVEEDGSATRHNDLKLRRERSTDLFFMEAISTLTSQDQRTGRSVIEEQC